MCLLLRCQVKNAVRQVSKTKRVFPQIIELFCFVTFIGDFYCTRKAFEIYILQRLMEKNLSVQTDVLFDFVYAYVILFKFK